MTNIEILKEIHSAQAALYTIYEVMLDLLLEERIDISDFASYHALSQMLEKCAAEAAPPYEPLTWANFLKAMEQEDNNAEEKHN